MGLFENVASLTNFSELQNVTFSIFQTRWDTLYVKMLRTSILSSSQLSKRKKNFCSASWCTVERHLRIPKNLVGHMSVLLLYCMSKSNQQKRRPPSSFSPFFLAPFLLKMTSCQSDWGKEKGSNLIPISLSIALQCKWQKY